MHLLPQDLRRVPIGGGAVTVIAPPTFTNSPYASLSPNPDGFIYFANDVIGRIHSDGTNPFAYPPVPLGNLATSVYDNYVYINQPGTFWRLDPTKQAFDKIVEAHSNAQIALDNVNVYWTQGTSLFSAPRL